MKRCYFSGLMSIPGGKLTGNFSRKSPDATHFGESAPVGCQKRGKIYAI